MIFTSLLRNKSVGLVRVRQNWLGFAQFRRAKLVWFSSDEHSWFGLVQFLFMHYTIRSFNKAGFDKFR